MISVIKHNVYDLLLVRYKIEWTNIVTHLFDPIKIESKLFPFRYSFHIYLCTYVSPKTVIFTP